MGRWGGRPGRREWAEGRRRLEVGMERAAVLHVGGQELPDGRTVGERNEATGWVHVRVRDACGALLCSALLAARLLPVLEDKLHRGGHGEEGDSTEQPGEMAGGQ